MNEQKPVDWDELFPGRFLKSGEFKGRKVTLTISDVDTDTLPEKNGGNKVRGIISFRETPKQLALNKTNGICFKELLGRKVQEWIGHKITLFPEPYQGETAIRVWGSPELSEDKEIEIELPRKRPFRMTMHSVKPSGKARERQPGEDDE